MVKVIPEEFTCKFRSERNICNLIAVYCKYSILKLYSFNTPIFVSLHLPSYDSLPMHFFKGTVCWKKGSRHCKIYLSFRPMYRRMCEVHDRAKIFWTFCKKCMEVWQGGTRVYDKLSWLSRQPTPQP